MTPSMHRQRGEGKIGCFVSLTIFLLAIAIGFKVVPVLWSENEFKDAAKDLASRASILPVPTIEAQLRAKARELEILEAMEKGAIAVTKTGDTFQGTCSVNLRYSRKIDFYGVTTYTLVTDTQITTPYINAR